MIAAFLLFPYVVLLALCISALRKGSKRPARQAPDASLPLTVVVCVSHESPEEFNSLLASLASVLKTSAYDEDKVLFVLDGASEACTEAARIFQAEHQGRVNIILHAARLGKKASQRKAVEAATTENIVALDADCSVGESFLNTVRQEVAAEDQMLLLPVAMRGDCSVLGRLTEMEFTCLQVVTAGTALLGFPTMANGAGMAFSRKLFLSHDSHNEYASGDDMFLLNHAVETGANVSFSTDGHTLVETAAPATLQAYLRQRTRWLSKSGGYGGFKPVHAVALTVLLGNVAWPLAVALALCGVSSALVTMAVFFAKLLADMACYASGRTLWRNKVNIAWAIALEIIYPLMISVVGLRALFHGKEKW